MSILTRIWRWLRRRPPSLIAQTTREQWIERSSLARETLMDYDPVNPVPGDIKRAVGTLAIHRSIRAGLIHANPHDYLRNDSCPCGSGAKFKRCCLPVLEEKTDE